MPYLPELCERLLGEPLRLPSVETWWCGEETALRYVLDHLGALVVRPTSRGRGRSVRGAALTAPQREQVMAEHQGHPAPLRRSAGAEPVLGADHRRRRAGAAATWCCARSRSAHGASYTAMLGGLARVSDDSDAEPRGPGHRARRRDRQGRLGGQRAARSLPAGRPRRGAGSEGEAGLVAVVDAATAAMVPRVLADLFWFGRYAERAEDLLRLILATRTVAIETDLDTTPGRALEVLLEAVTHVSTTYPGFLRDRVGR